MLTKYYSVIIIYHTPRKGELWLELKGGRVLIAGKAKLYLKGIISNINS